MARGARDRELLAPLDLEHATDRDVAWLIGRLTNALRRGDVWPSFWSPSETREAKQRAAAECNALRRYLTRRRMRVLPGGRSDRDGGA